MGSLLGFPLAMQLGGVDVSEVYILPLGNRVWELRWTPFIAPTEQSFMIAIDGKHYMTTNELPPIRLKLPGTVDGFVPTPIIDVVQIPSNYSDPGFFTPGYFAAVIPNKLKVKWNAPVSVVDLFEYRVYWDKGTGTVQFTNAFQLATVLEVGSSQYSVFTPPLTSGTYKFVVRAADEKGNETTNITETSLALTTYPGHITNFALSYSNTTKKATLTWTDPSDIGSGTVKIFDNAGDITKPFPDYTTIVSSVAAGTQTFTTAVLTEGLWTFGARVDDGTNRELNTSLWVRVRLDASANQLTNPSPIPILTAKVRAGGKVGLLAIIPKIQGAGIPTKVNFFTNDGTGGPVDFTTPISPGDVTVRELVYYHRAFLETAVFGETARKFVARSLTSDNQPSLNSQEETVTPDATAPSVPTGVVVTTGRE